MINKKLTRTILVGASVLSATVIMPELAMASAKFDINAGVTAAATPLVTALDAHWGKGVLLSGGAAALIGEGDSRQRAIRAAIGCAASGGVVLALLAMLN
jgi:hypothetical protein